MKRIRFTRQFVYEGRTYQPGEVADLPDAIADSMVSLAVAERAATGNTVTVTDEQLDRLLDDPTDEEVERETERLAREGMQRSAPNLVPENQRQSVAFSEDHNTGVLWRRRAVRYLSALVTESDDPEAGRRQLRALRREVMEMPEQQERAEERSAHQTITAAVEARQISREQGSRLASMLEVGPFTRLHTTSTADTAKAGLLLPKPFLAEVFVIVEQYGVARRLFRAVTMTSKTLDLKNVASKVTAYWTDEGANFQASDLQFGDGELATKKLAGITSWTTEQEEDQAILLLPILIQSFAEAIAKAEDEAFLVGDGTSTYGGWTGLLNFSGTTVVTMGAGKTSGADFDETEARRAKQALSLARRIGARWVMHPSFEDVIQLLENGAGFRIYQPTGVRDGMVDRFLGFPIEWCESYPSVDEVGAEEKFASLGNYNRVLFGQRRGVTADVSREAILQAANGDIAYNAFQADGALLRISERVGVAPAPGVVDSILTLKTAAV